MNWNKNWALYVINYKIGIKLESGALRPATGTTNSSFKNSGTLCPYYRDMGMFILINAIFCTYFLMNGPDHGHFDTI
ncbi:hypothetical protein PbDSM24746_39730 [Paenibacillus macerans]|nr:hypothetical protein PbDSM24746_39730 [Paenibacillus macerans]GBK70282.1 hypothetical protein PbJCM17693_39900 [Paenibacillus macerans]GIP14038.1 hypothetical protein J1TS5_62080 [Paenibacillus macerans]